MGNDNQNEFFFRKKREEKEDYESKNLSSLAKFSCDSKGRSVFEEPDEFKTCYEVDIARILSSDDYADLNGRTQVFTLPKSHNVRNRLIHTQNVARLATYVARNLGLNEDLTAAIAYGHDVGHPPGGHKGERVLSDILGRSFKHQENSVIVLERNRFNLTHEVKDGILKHSCGMGRVDECELPETNEGMVVAYVDKGEYVFHDIDEAVRARIITEGNLPLSTLKTFGKNLSERIETFTESMINYALGSHEIGLSKNVYNNFEDLREFMYKYVYRNIKIAHEEDKFGRGLEELFYRMPFIEEFYHLDQNNKEEIAFALSRLTDTEALKYINEYRSPNTLA
ncbi:MAG: HD domain-containing protein [Nanoarchaeota archaeon]|nr:HD domain-containing protein [Nanoarchaeota archaeon]MBU1135349.1 HD domain-containing protein [Nanoarchaeota archaeon]MBU2519713.1 HD domain-containing protein [Nanoarchaeota archaeon]